MTNQNLTSRRKQEHGVKAEGAEAVNLSRLSNDEASNTYRQLKAQTCCLLSWEFQVQQGLQVGQAIPASRDNTFQQESLPVCPLEQY